MGKRGPPPLPAAIKKARGTHQKCRDATNAVDAPVGAPDCPPALAKNKIAVAKWNELVPQLLALGVLSKIDASALELCCWHLAQGQRFRELAEKQPMIKTPFGPKVNPACNEARKHDALAKQLLEQFGLTPSSRTRVSGPPKDKDDTKAKAAAFLFGAGGPPPLQSIPGGKAGA